MNVILYSWAPGHFILLIRSSSAWQVSLGLDTLSTPNCDFDPAEERGVRSVMLGSERVSEIRQDMAWARRGQAAAIRPGPGLKANISTEPSCHGQPGARDLGRERPAPADSGSECDHCESCVQSPAPESHRPERSQSQSQSRSRGITTGAPHPHTVTYKPPSGEEQWTVGSGHTPQKVTVEAELRNNCAWKVIFDIFLLRGLADF